MILIIVKFSEPLLWISLRINALRRYIKHMKECFIRYRIISKLVKKNSGSAAPHSFNPLLRVRISDETLLFDILHEQLEPGR